MAGPAKKFRTAEQLRTLVQLRIDDLPSVRQRSRDRLPVPVAGLPWRAGDSWSLLVTPIEPEIDRAVSAIVEAMRRDYDLA